MLGHEDSLWLSRAASQLCHAAGVGALGEGAGRYPGSAGVLGGQGHLMARGKLGWNSPGEARRRGWGPVRTAERACQAR